MRPSSLLSRSGSAGPASGSWPPGLRQLLLAQSLSQLGFQLLSLAMPLLATTTLRAPAIGVSAVSASQTAAFLVVGLPAGAWVDRLRKRPVMITADLVRAVALATIPILWAAGHLALGYLCVVAFVVGVLSVFFDVADQSYLPHLVSPDELVSANAKLVTVEQLAGIAGPGVGGVLIQMMTAPFAIIAVSAGYLWSACCIFLIGDDEAKPEHRPGRRLLPDIGAGLRYVLGHPLLRPIVACSTTVTLFWSMSYGMLLVLLARGLHVPAATIGLVLTGGSLGGLAATFVVRPLVAALGDATVIKLSITLAAPATLLAVLVEPGWRLVLVSLASFLLNAGLVIYNIAQVSFRQRSVPPELLGRVNATVRFFAWGARPVGALTGGLIAELAGLRHAVLVGALGTALAAGWLYASALRSLRELPVTS
jgi:hypothetical protein